LAELKYSADRLETIEYDNASCHVTILIDYNLEKTDIAFGYINEQISSGLLIIRTGVQLTDNIVNQHIQDISILNHLVYKCSTSNKCNYDFMFNHTQWLIEANYNDLAASIVPLLSIADHERGMLNIE
jgi:hypothetical protein